jgi:SPP1 family predicted phage head-tail adaptor
MALLNSTIGKNGAGVYRHYIAITQNVTTSTGQRGQDVSTPTTIVSCFAAIEPLSGRKLDLARQVVATATHEITIRYFAGVVPECQVSYQGRIFNVGSVRDLNENQYEMVLTASEVV